MQLLQEHIMFVHLYTLCIQIYSSLWPTRLRILLHTIFQAPGAYLNVYIQGQYNNMLFVYSIMQLINQ